MVERRMNLTERARLIGVAAAQRCVADREGASVSEVTARAVLSAGNSVLTWRWKAASEHVAAAEEAARAEVTRLLTQGQAVG